MLISSFVKENSSGTFKAEIHDGKQGYSIKYFSPSGENFKNENFPDKSLKEVADIAEQWVEGVQNING